MTAVCVVLMVSATGVADDQKLPPTVKAGADFIWHVAHADNLEEALDFDETKATVELTAKSKVLLEKMTVDLKKIRAGLEPSVVACKQEYFNREMTVIFVLSSQTNTQKYYRLHMVEVSRPPLIDEIEELTWRDALEGKCLRIEQKVPQPE